MDPVGGTRFRIAVVSSWEKVPGHCKKSGEDLGGNMPYSLRSAVCDRDHHGPICSSRMIARRSPRESDA